MKVVIFGASGMVGKGVLRASLAADDVYSVVVVGRSPTGVAHTKLSEHVTKDLQDVAAYVDRIGNADACLFCLGASSAGMKEPDYRRITYELTIAVADALKATKPEMTFIYVSGAGSDSSAKGRVMWARVKGETENAVIARFPKGYAFRPAFIHAAHGEVSKTPAYRRLYFLLAIANPVLKLFGDKYWTSTELIGRAMLRLAREGGPKHVLESEDIGRLGRGA